MDARIAARLSRQDVASALGVTVSTVEGWERPSGDGPGAATLVAAAKLLGAPRLVTLLVEDAGWVVGPPGDGAAARLAEERAATRARLARVRGHLENALAEVAS